MKKNIVKNENTGIKKNNVKKQINILALGDVVAKYGVNELEKKLKNIILNNNINFCVVNAENSENGLGISKKVYNILNRLNIDCITLGDHSWNRMEIFELLDNDNIIRPANYPDCVKGKGYVILKKEGIRYLVISLLGRAFINAGVDNPFAIFDKIYEKEKGNFDIGIIDFHAEATAEKISFFKYASKKMNLVFGTHTHVQTADEKIENNCAYITDLGMCGKNGGVIGMDVEVALKRQILGLPEKYKISDEGKVELNGIIASYELAGDEIIAKDIKRVKY